MSVKKHWSVNADTMPKGSTKSTRWALEERINFGIGDETIQRNALRVHWDEMDIDPWKRRALALALE